MKENDVNFIQGVVAGVMIMVCGLSILSVVTNHFIQVRYDKLTMLQKAEFMNWKAGV